MSKERSISACTHAQQRTMCINTHKATRDIAAGQEILVQYRSSEWFKVREISFGEVDYASTVWRPDLCSLPCRQNVAKIIGEDGRHSFAVQEAVPSGTVLETSLCVEISIVAVDQFPPLWDFVFTGESKNGSFG